MSLVVVSQPVLVLPIKHYVGIMGSVEQFMAMLNASVMKVMLDQIV